MLTTSWINKNSQHLSVHEPGVKTPAGWETSGRFPLPMVKGKQRWILKGSEGGT